MRTTTMAALSAAIAACGCFNIKTESEIKPIHITMDVNLKIDNMLDREFADERRPAPQARHLAVKGLLDRKVAGLTALAMLEPRDGASDDDKISIAEENMKRLARFQEIAKASGVSVEAVQKRHAAKIRSRIPAGSGVWVQEADGTWKRL